jgi:hypothetical protein
VLVLWLMLQPDCLKKMHYSSHGTVEDKLCETE